MMEAIAFLKTGNFKIKAKKYEFKDEEYLSAADKQKIYKKFVSLLNNHFKQSSFTKAIYTYSYVYLGFIAHYDIHGFYGTYFSAADAYHEYIERYANETDEGTWNANRKEKFFYNIYRELAQDEKCEGVGGYVSVVENEQYWGANCKIEDINEAIKELIVEYKQEWSKRIKEANEKFEKFSQEEKTSTLMKQKEMLVQERERIAKEIEQKEKDLLKEAKGFKESRSTMKKEPQQELNLFDFIGAA